MTNLDMTTGNTRRDYVTIFNDLLSLLPAVCPEWTYTGDDDPGIAILQLLSYLADHLHYRADAAMRDLLPSTTTQRNAIVDFAEWLGYPIAGRQPALADVTFSIPAISFQEVVIPAGTWVSSKDVVYELLNESAIPAGQTSVTVTMLEGLTINSVPLGVASGGAFEEFIVPDLNVIFNHYDADFQVYVGAQQAEFVRWPALATSDELVYWVRERANGQLAIRFGNAKYGAVLTPGASVTATYRIGGGVRGRVIAGELNTLVTPLFYADNTPASVTVTNALGSVGGADPDTLQAIQQKAPAYIRSQDRAVTLQDYELFAKMATGVERARASIVGLNGVQLHVIPAGATGTFTLPESIVTEITEALRARQMATDVVSVLPATLVPVDATLNIGVKSNYRRSSVLAAVRTAFTEAGGILSRDSVDLGITLHLSDMIGVLEALPGVDYVQAGRYTRRPLGTWLTKSGDATLSSIEIASSTISQTWTLQFLSPTTFNVVGEVSGMQGTIGTVGIPYVVDGQLSFIIAAGGVPMAVGDKATIQVGRLLWDIEFNTYEMPEPGTLLLTGVGGY